MESENAEEQKTRLRKEKNRRYYLKKKANTEHKDERKPNEVKQGGENDSPKVEKNEPSEEVKIGEETKEVKIPDKEPVQQDIRPDVMAEFKEELMTKMKEEMIKMKRELKVEMTKMKKHLVNLEERVKIMEGLPEMRLQLVTNKWKTQMQKEGKSDSDMPDSELEKCCLSDPSDTDDDDDETDSADSESVPHDRNDVTD